MKRILKFVIPFSIFFLIWTFLAPFLATNLIIEKTLERADAIFVLSGSGTYIERTNKAAELYKNGVAPKIILTNDGEFGSWSNKEQKNPAFVEMAQKNLIKNGVRAENIEILEPQVSGTIWEAKVFVERAENNDLKKVLLVTSAYHSSRTLKTFEKVLAENKVEIELGIVSPPTGIQTPNPQFWWLKPRGWQQVAGEYLKSAVYWLFY